MITVKIDNKRAERAFRKGLNDLNDIWPVIEDAVKKEEDKIAEIEKKIDDEKEIDAKEYREKLEEYIEYEKKLKEWNISGPGLFFQNKKPAYVSKPYEISLYPSISYIRPRICISTYELVKEELTAKMNVANAAVGEFEVSHEYANEMVKCEDGTKIEGILKHLKRISHDNTK